MDAVETPALAVQNDGTQAIRRAASILRQIARAGSPGATLREICAAADLSRSTAHRILKCLVEERLVAQNAEARRYRIGELTSELGLAATGVHDAALRWRAVVEALARDTGATAYVIARSGLESVCLQKADGSSVVRVIPVEIGQRRPLGVGAGATALLAALPEDEAERALAAIAPVLRDDPRMSLASVSEAVRRARRLGFAESRNQVVEGVCGLGVAIPRDDGPSILALSLAAHESLASPRRIEDWTALLLRAARSRP